MYFIQRGDELFPIVSLELVRDGLVIVSPDGSVGPVPPACSIVQATVMPAPPGFEVPTFDVSDTTVTVRWRPVLALRAVEGLPVAGLISDGQWRPGVVWADRGGFERQQAVLAALGQPGAGLGASQLALLLRYRESVRAWPTEQVKPAFTTEGEQPPHRRSA